MTLPSNAAPVIAGETYDYPDKIQIWLRKPVSRDEECWLRQQSEGRIRFWTARAKFNRPGNEWRQRITLFQPSFEMLLFFLGRGGIVNHFEPAREQLPPDDDANLELFHLLVRTFVKSHHHRQVSRIVEGTTFYSGPPSAPSLFVAYPDRHSKVTGELPCFRHEWKFRGHVACRNAGYGSIEAIVQFDPDAFWQKHLFLAEVDRRKLGRMYLNHILGQRRRTPRIKKSGKFRYDVDLATGNAIVRALGTTQNVIDELSFIRVRRCLKRIPWPL